MHKYAKKFPSPLSELRELSAAVPRKSKVKRNFQVAENHDEDMLLDIK